MSDTKSTAPCPDPPRASEQIFEAGDLTRPIVPETLFELPSDAGVPPLEVEVGCGNGRYLRRAAAERPGHLFVGVERSAGYARRARDRMVKYGVGNVRVVRADATALLDSHFAPASIHALHVYFTDPWPKRRHAKRRLFQTPFLETLHRVLRPGAMVYVKVDLFWYFEEILCRFDFSPHFRVAACGMESDRERDLYEITGFEQKALQNKGVVFCLAARHGVKLEEMILSTDNGSEYGGTERRERKIGYHARVEARGVEHRFLPPRHAQRPRRRRLHVPPRPRPW